MFKLRPEDRLRLVRSISEIPEFATEPNRAQLVKLAGIDGVIRMIDLSGSPFMASASLVDYLIQYGAASDGLPALGRFLNVLSGVVGAERQAEFRTLIERYNLTTPVAVQPAVASWLTPADAASVREKIIRANTLRPISFLAQGVQVARSVAYLEVPDGRHRWSGTGFLVAPDLLLTNAHVLPTAAHAAHASYVFNYENDADGRARPVERFAAGAGLLATDEALDYSLVELAGRPGDTWGWLPLRRRSIDVNARVNIIQHPAGQPKQVALQTNFVEAVDDTVLQYVTSTLPGSSGAPVLDDGWQVVGLHHAGGNLPDPLSGTVYFRNEGIRVNAILNDLPGALTDRLGEGSIR